MSDESIAAIAARDAEMWPVAERLTGPRFGPSINEDDYLRTIEDRHYLLARLREVEQERDKMADDHNAANAETFMAGIEYIDRMVAAEAERDAARASEKRAYTLLVSVQPCVHRMWLESPNGTAVRLNGVLKDAIQEWVDQYLADFDGATT